MKIKKVTTLAALFFVATLLPLSCQQAVEPTEDPNLGQTTEMVSLVIAATQRDAETSPAGSDTRASDPDLLDPETRTVLVDGTKVWWLPADQLTVFSSVNKASFLSLNEEAAPSAYFSGSIEVDPEDSYYIHALYPYDADATCVSGTFTTTLSSDQNGVDGTFADDLMILAGRAHNPFIHSGEIGFNVSSTGMEVETYIIDDEGGMTWTDTPAQSGGSSSPAIPAGAKTLKMSFENVCSGLRFTLTQEDIETVTLTATGGEPIAGTFSFAYNQSGLPEMTSVTNPSSSITLTAPDGGTFTPGVWYYFVTLPVTFSQGVTFTLTSGNRVGTRTISTPFSLNRGAFKKSTGLDRNVDLEELEVEVQIAGPDTWVATDELHRVTPTAITDQNVPAARDNRKVVMFYSSWHTDHQVTYSPIVNVTGVEWFYPEAMNNAHHGAWGNSSDPSHPQVCFWGEPLFGYYRTTDPWVLRKHAEMLADAGVDAVVFDCTNGEYLWLSSVKALLETWSQAKADGVNVPKIAFMLQLSVQTSSERHALRMLYYGEQDNSAYDNRSSLKGFYGRGEYSDLWFRLDGDTKPFIMAYPASLDSNNSSDMVIKNFFTWRPGQGDYVYGDHPDVYGNHQWGWLQVYPQNKFYEHNGETEQMTVGVAQNATDGSGGHCFAINAPGSYGRSHTHAHGNDYLVEPSYAGEVTSFKYGYNFQEQWDRALEVDPHYVFITQWNEWIALKMETWPPVGSSQGSFGAPNPPGYSFADQFDAERSRDIEPTANWGDNGDNYYYQLVKNVRKYKGVGAYPNVSRKMTMAIDGSFTEWEKVSPDFKHYPGNTLHRDHDGHSSKHYTNTSGRNDFVDARVTRDRNYVYFYVKTKSAITSRTDQNWMRLLINIDRDVETGWKGYDFCLNYRNPSSATEGYVSACTDGTWNWSDAGTFDYRVVGNQMEIRVPRSVLGLSATQKLDFEFKWCDNNLVERLDDAPQVTRILSLYVDGDAAPGGRFNFHYKEP